MRLPRYLVFCFITALCANALNAQSNSRVITTGVPFLLITPDARSAGMGELGVATSADVYSQQWNPAKYVFSEKSQGVGISYTPYLSKLVDDIFLANITYFSKNTERSAWGASLKYFSLGDIQFNDLIGNTIVQQGIERPNELTLDISYGLLLNEKFSLAVAGRFIRSDLKVSSDVDATPASTIGVDIAAYYQGEVFELGENKARMRHGINISNIGPRLKYDEGGQKNYIPTNLRIGSGLDFIDSDFGLLRNAAGHVIPLVLHVIDAADRPEGNQLLARVGGGRSISVDFSDPNVLIEHLTTLINSKVDAQSCR